MNGASARDEWLARLQQALADGTLVKFSLGQYRGPDRGLKKVIARPVALRAGPRLSLVYRYPTKDMTRNVPPEDGFKLVAAALGTEFQSAFLASTEATAELTCRPDGTARLVLGAGHSAPADPSHDRTKSRWIDPRTERWLQALGVTTPSGAVCRGLEPKFRQIHRFTEILAPLLPLPGAEDSRELHVVDMGCGKGYLTFAAYRTLQRAGWEPRVRGVEARPELVESGNRVAREHGFTHLRFECGTIATTSMDRVEVLLALHACDTATDDALAQGIRAGASVILAAPCCHHELRPQLRPPPALARPCQHGILRERQAEWVTDALRAALLEWAGYQTQVFEFIATEHTAKNLMIAARKQPAPAGRELRATHVRELAGLFGVRHQRLADQLQFPWSAA